MTFRAVHNHILLVMKRFITVRTLVLPYAGMHVQMHLQLVQTRKRSGALRAFVRHVACVVANVDFQLRLSFVRRPANVTRERTVILMPNHVFLQHVRRGIAF